jgi:predicted HD phosphohydrolase
MRGGEMTKVDFVRMENGTKEEYLFLQRLEKEDATAVASRVLQLLEALRGSYGGYQVDRYQHSLQAATRAHRDGASEELVVAALLHDIGDLLALFNHGEFAAAILRPYVAEETYWIVKHHGIFQAFYYAHHLGEDRYARERYRDSPYYSATVNFCQNWDQCSFDPGYATKPIDAFEPMVRRVLSRKPSQLNEKVSG